MDKVKGYQPKDAVVYEPVSYLQGVIEKYQPGDYEFDVPEKLIELYNTKDFGPYGVNGKMPIKFYRNKSYDRWKFRKSSYRCLKEI